MHRKRFFYVLLLVVSCSIQNSVFAQDAYSDSSGNGFSATLSFYDIIGGSGDGFMSSSQTATINSNLVIGNFGGVLGPSGVANLNAMSNTGTGAVPGTGVSTPAPVVSTVISMPTSTTTFPPLNTGPTIAMPALYNPNFIAPDSSAIGSAVSIPSIDLAKDTFVSSAGVRTNPPLGDTTIAVKFDTPMSPGILSAFARAGITMKPYAINVLKATFQGNYMAWNTVGWTTANGGNFTIQNNFYSAGNGLGPASFNANTRYYSNAAMEARNPELGGAPERAASLRAVEAAISAVVNTGVANSWNKSQLWDRAYYIGLQDYIDSTNNPISLPTGPLQAQNSIDKFIQRSDYNFINAATGIDAAYRAGFLNISVRGEIFLPLDSSGNPVYSKAIAPDYATQGNAVWGNVQWLGAMKNIVISGDYQQIQRLGFLPPGSNATTYLRATSAGESISIVPMNNPDYDFNATMWHELWWAGLNTIRNYGISDAGQALILSGTALGQTVLNGVTAAFDAVNASGKALSGILPGADNIQSNNLGAAEVIATLVEPLDPKMAARHPGATSNFAAYLSAAGEDITTANNVCDQIKSMTAFKKIIQDIDAISGAMVKGIIK